MDYISASTEPSTVVVAEFSIPGEPSSKARARFAKRGNKMHAYTPEKTKSAQQQVAAAFLTHTRKKFTDPDVSYSIRAHFYHATMQRRDVDNMLKLILDGLNGIAYPDDVQVIEVIGRKSLVSKEHARTDVQVAQIGTVERPMGTCEYCGDEYRTYNSWIGGEAPRRFCSSECHRSNQQELRVRKCEECKNTFEASGPNASPKFCSVECKRAAGRVSVECSYCGSAFTKQKCYLRESNYCTGECMRAAQAIRRKSRTYGTCRVCGGGTTRKEYTRCNPCRIAEDSSGGKPRRLT